jgi:ligand-binding sensor domain-containing protein
MVPLLRILLKRMVFGDNRLFSIMQARDGNIWFSTAARGIVKYDGKRFEIFDKDNGFESVRVFKVFEDSQGNIWSCTSGEGAAKYDGNTFETYTKQNGLPGNVIMTGFEDSRKNIWFGHFGNGISKYQNGSFVDFGKKYKIPANHVRGICEDKLGNIWFGTSTLGIFRVDELNADSAVCYYINKKNGLSSNNLYFVFCDRSGNLWGGTEKGIDKIILDENGQLQEIHNYSKSEGFIGVETSINGAMQDSEGSLWFGSLIGATKFNPAIERRNKKPPATFVTNVKLFYEDTSWHAFTDSIDQHGVPHNLRLNHRQNNLTFEFTGICFTNPEKLNIALCLTGWMKTGLHLPLIGTQPTPTFLREAINLK